MLVKVLKPKIREFLEIIKKYAKLRNEKFCICNLHTTSTWIEFVSNHNFNMHFSNKYGNASSSEP